MSTLLKDRVRYISSCTDVFTFKGNFTFKTLHAIQDVFKQLGMFIMDAHVVLKLLALDFY